MEKDKMAKSLNVNMDFVPPAEKPKQPRKCPFRKIYFGESIWDGSWCPDNLESASRVVEEFQECIGNECACYTPFGCGRK